MATRLFAQDNNSAVFFNLSENLNPNDSVYISSKISKSYGVKKLNFSAKNVTILDVYQKLYRLQEERFLIPQNLNYIFSDSLRYNVEFEGDNENQLVEKLEVTLNLRSKKVNKDSECLVFNEIINGTALQPLTDTPLKRDFSTESSKEGMQVQGTMSIKDLADFISKQLVLPVNLENLPENQVYKVFMSFDGKSSKEDIIAKYKSFGISLENRKAISEFIQIENRTIN
jgi:hypothetical protein